MAKHRTIKRLLRVPIYDCKLWVVLCDDVAKERVKWNDVLGEMPEGENWEGLCAWNGHGTFALFFMHGAGLKCVSHEVFHLTHRILDWVSANFDENHHEQGALLYAYLLDVVLDVVRMRIVKTRTK